MKSVVRDFKCQTFETGGVYPLVCVSAEIMFTEPSEIRGIDTRSLRDQIEKAIVSTVATVKIAITEKGGAK